MQLFVRFDTCNRSFNRIFATWCGIPLVRMASRMERIEFCFFDAGGGHRAAATALEMAIQAQQRPWEIRLTNLQELLDPLDIVRKYAGIRIQDVYNWMLQSGWTLGSAQIMRLLQTVIRMYHRPTVRLLEAHWKETQPDMLVSFVPHFNRALQESFQRAFPGRPFVTVLTDFADYPPHFWIERAAAIFRLRHRPRRGASARDGPSGRAHISRIGNDSASAILRSAGGDPLAERERLGLRPDLPTGLVLFGGHGSHAMREIAERLEPTRNSTCN